MDCENDSGRCCGSVVAGCVGRGFGCDRAMEICGACVAVNTLGTDTETCVAGCTLANVMGTLERRVIYDGGEASRIACALPATGYETDAVQVSDCGSDAARVTGCQNGAEQETGCDQGHLSEEFSTGCGFEAPG